MGRVSKAFTKRSTVWGLPIGRRRTDWAKVGRASMVGLSAISAVADLADGLRSARDGKASETQPREDRAERRAGSKS